MEQKGKPSLPRQASFSGRNSIGLPMVGFAKWKKLMCVGVFFAAGLLCGHIISQLVGPPTELSAARLARADNLHPAAQRAALIAEAEKAGEKNVHSRRKDLSVQFRDYVPRHIFINCGGTFPKSVELFIDTYPSSEKYVIFSFIPDESFAPLYSVYQSHMTISPALCAAKNGSIKLEQQPLTGKSKNSSVPTVDIAQWILDNTHADEYIVLKIEAHADVEKGIAKRMAETSAIEWVNKFYTTTHDRRVVEVYIKEFSLRREDVESWDEAGETYSDFDKLNPTRNPPTTKAIIKECGNSKLKKYPLFLYASESTPSLNNTLNLLLALADSKGNRLPFAVFLPFSFVKINRLLLETLYTRIDVGIYFNSSVKSTDKENDKLVFGRIRNQFVAAENRFGSVGLILQHVLAGRAVNSSLVERLVQERHYNIFVKTIDIEQDSDGFTSKADDMPQIQDYEVPVLDISRPGSVMKTLLLLRRHEKHIMPLTECLKYSSKAS